VTDLAILVPSRGRPANVARLAEACAKTCRTSYVLHFGFDADDPALDANMAAAPLPDVRATERHRMGLTEWTNHLALDHMASPYLASVGDDMTPQTDGWDEQLITEIEHMGAGFAYPNDWRRDDIPEAVIVSTPIVADLGWFALPVLHHWFIDNVWADLGRGAGCLAYCPTVHVPHWHPNVTGGPADATYYEAAPHFAADQAAYRKWKLYQMPKDVAMVRRVKDGCSKNRS
jgi:hypothetical protein